MRYFLFALTFLIAVAIAFCWHDYHAAGVLPEDKTVLIPHGSGFRGAVDILGKEQIVAHPLVFSAIAFATGNAKHLKAGEYAFSAGATPADVMAKMVKGEVVVHKVTIPEGYRTTDVIELLKQEPLLTGDIMGHLAEGSLLPETYHFTYGDDRNHLIARMQTDMQKLVTSLWPGRDPNVPVKTPEEALVLASIVEKETSVDGERPRIAAVFENRLKRGMKLQSDPTTIYAIEVEKGLLGRALITKDLAYDSPFNTYAYVGLPPAPICNPGAAAINAVLHPADSDALYFVATGEGGHYFSATLAEHNANVKKYREMLKKQKAAN